MVRTFIEPTLDDLLTDPLVQMVMRSDGLSRGLVRELMEAARRTLALQPMHLAPHIRPTG